MMVGKNAHLLLAATALIFAGCFSEEPTGLTRAEVRNTTIKFDMLHKPLPEIPLPNNVATRYDPSSATGRRINASLLAPTTMEARLRTKLAQVDGFGLLEPITIPFTGLLDVESILAGHRDANYDTSNDVIYLLNVDPQSPEYGKVHHLDIGNGNYPIFLEERDNYWPHDSREFTISLLFEEEDEDLNGNGTLDPGEDTDGDGVLDKPNYLPGLSPAKDDLAGRADALMTFYERETHTLIAKPLVPLRERTTYAVVVTKRLRDAKGESVGSPFAYTNHTSQTEELRPLAELLPRYDLGLEDVAFAFSFTTQSVESNWRAVRDGLYGHGTQAHLASEFPAEIATIDQLRDADYFKGAKKLHLLYAEQLIEPLKLLAQDMLSSIAGGETLTMLLQSLRHIDYFVLGSYESPQLFARKDAEGNYLPFDDQAWPEDLDRTPAKATSETINFWLAVPRKESSVRGQGKPAPVALVAHGYTGSRIDLLVSAGLFAQHGIASIAIDAKSHGLGLNDDVEGRLVKALLARYGLSKMGEAVLRGRSLDLNGDGAQDSGADFFSSYLFHTRDMLRQSVVDYMQLVRILRTFDGTRGWKFGFGDRIAGDFDGDGFVDIGGDGKIVGIGASLGGMIITVLSSLEPHISSVTSIVGGGVLSDIGIRSLQGGVPEAFLLRTMGPLFIGTPSAEGGTVVRSMIPDLNDKAEIPIATVGKLDPGDSVLASNLDNNERACGLVNAKGAFRLSLPCNKGDRVVLTVYRGEAVSGVDCKVAEDATLRVQIDAFAEKGSFYHDKWEAGDPLVAMAEGLGLPRVTPSLRRLTALSPIVLDSADPAVMARHLAITEGHEPMHYPATGEKTGAHMLFITSLGDMSVPVASGMAMARSAGLIDYLQQDARYGKSTNQVLIDTYTAEGVHTFKRHVDANGRGVHMDVDNFSQGNDANGPDYPRLDPPLRIGFDKQDALGGKSGAVFGLSDPAGQHAFYVPGEEVEKAQEKCKKECEQPGDDDPCHCADLQPFDIGTFLFNLAGRYVGSDGQKLDADLCLSRNDCPEFPPPPPLRTVLP